MLLYYWVFSPVLLDYPRSFFLVSLSQLYVPGFQNSFKKRVGVPFFCGSFFSVVTRLLRVGFLRLNCFWFLIIPILYLMPSGCIILGGIYGWVRLLVFNFPLPFWETHPFFPIYRPNWGSWFLPPINGCYPSKFLILLLSWVLVFLLVSYPP